jgi:hypothetical protein
MCHGDVVGRLADAERLFADLPTVGEDMADICEEMCHFGKSEMLPTNELTQRRKDAKDGSLFPDEEIDADLVHEPLSDVLGRFFRPSDDRPRFIRDLGINKRNVLGRLASCAFVSSFCVFATLREAFGCLRPSWGFRVTSTVLAWMLGVAIAHAESPLVLPASDEAFHGDLLSIDPQGQITFRDGSQQRAMPLADLVRWGQCPERGRAAGILLPNGSWIVAEIVAVEKDNVLAYSDIFGSLKMPQKSVIAIVFSPASARGLFERQHGAVRNPQSPAPNSSVATVQLNNGDELTGRLLGFADGVVKFETDVGPIDVKAGRIAAIVFRGIEPRATDDADALRVWTGFTDGSRLLADSIAIEAKKAKLTVAGRTFAAPRSSLVFLQPIGGRAIYLSDVQPAEYQQTPYLDLKWPYRRDRSVTGSPLHCGGVYLKGIGVHAKARLVYLLADDKNSPRQETAVAEEDKDSPRPQAGEGPGVRAVGSFEKFATELAVDDSTGNRGSVQFRVVVDGEEKYASPVLRGGDRPISISIPIVGAEKLELIVDDADRLDVLDHADWLEARLIK